MSVEGLETSVLTITSTTRQWITIWMAEEMFPLTGSGWKWPTTMSSMRTEQIAIPDMHRTSSPSDG